MAIGQGAAIIGGSVLSGLFGSSSASRSMRFQKQMAKNAHQWEVEDLRKAGLNPILSGTGGPGARASGGAMPPIPDFGTAAQAAQMVEANVANVKSLTKLNEAKTGAIQPVSIVGETLGEGLSSAKALIADMFTRAKQREREADAKKRVKKYKLKEPFKQKSTPLYTRDTYGN